MSWAVGYDGNWQRDIGYGVPSICDAPKCAEKIDRGLSYVCGGDPYGGEHGCGLYFCSAHLFFSSRVECERCKRCSDGRPPYKRPKPDTPEWMAHKMTDASWQRWRDENPAECAALATALGVPLLATASDATTPGTEP